MLYYSIRSHQEGESSKKTRLPDSKTLIFPENLKCGDDRIRTGNLLNAIEALYH